MSPRSSFAAPGDTTPVVVLAWALGALAAAWGMWVLATGRARLVPRSERVFCGPLVRLVGLGTILVGAALVYFVMTHPAVEWPGP